MQSSETKVLIPGGTMTLPVALSGHWSHCQKPWGKMLWTQMRLFSSEPLEGKPVNTEQIPNPAEKNMPVEEDWMVYKEDHFPSFPC